MRESQHTIVQVIASRPARMITCAALAVAFAATPVISPISTAWAVSAETQAEINEAASQVDEYAAAYQEASDKLAELEAQIEENTSRIAEIEEELPAQQEAAAAAMRDSYKYRQGANPLVSLVLKSESLSEFITSCVYMDQIQSANNEAIESLNAAQEELEQKKAELDSAKVQAEAEKQKAEEALEAAQQARAAAQAKAEAEAAAELAALQAQSAAEQSAAGEGTGTSGGNPYSDATNSGTTVSGPRCPVTGAPSPRQLGTPVPTRVGPPRSPASRARRASTARTASTLGASPPWAAVGWASAAGPRRSTITSPTCATTTAPPSRPPRLRSTARPPGRIGTTRCPRR